MRTVLFAIVLFVAGCASNKGLVADAGTAQFLANHPTCEGPWYYDSFDNGRMKVVFKKADGGVLAGSVTSNRGSGALQYLSVERGAVSFSAAGFKNVIRLRVDRTKNNLAGTNGVSHFDLACS